MELTREFLLMQLQNVIDPEVGLSIVDMGLVYGVEVLDGKVSVRMTLTTPGCPMGDYLTEEVRSALSPLIGVQEVLIEIVWEPQWSPERIKPEALARLNGERI